MEIVVVQPMLVGGCKFRPLFVGDDGQPRYECGWCRALVRERGLKRHAERHVEADERKRLIGSRTKPLPGQLGLLSPADDVPAKGPK